MAAAVSALYHFGTEVPMFWLLFSLPLGQASMLNPKACCTRT